MEALLQRVELLGHGELPAAGYAGRTWTVAGLRAEVRGRADDLAARFDARNGTTAHTDCRRARLDRAPLLEMLEPPAPARCTRGRTSRPPRRSSSPSRPSRPAGTTPRGVTP